MRQVLNLFSGWAATLYPAANDFPDELSFCLFICPLAAFLFRTRLETQVNKFISAEIGKRFFRSTLLDWKPLQYDLFPILSKIAARPG